MIKKEKDKKVKGLFVRMSVSKSNYIKYNLHPGQIILHPWPLIDGVTKVLIGK